MSTYTVAREMGHGGEAMVRKVHGHLGQVRHRAEAVEYRVEQHAAKLGGRHRSSVVELSIRNRAVVGSNPTGGSFSRRSRTFNARWNERFRQVLATRNPPLHENTAPIDWRTA